MANQNNWGGRRPGAGRKTLRDEVKLARALETALPHESCVKILQVIGKAAEGGDLRAATLALAYAFGRPGFVTVEEDNAPEQLTVEEVAEGQDRFDRALAIVYPETVSSPPGAHSSEPGA